MSDVKRYNADNLTSGDVVMAVGGDAILPEREKLARAMLSAHNDFLKQLESGIADMAAERDQLRAELDAIRGRPSAELIEAVRELTGAANTVNRSRMHEVRGHDDDQPRYWQRKEWVDWLVENGEKARKALDALPPQQPDAVSVPRELLEQLDRFYTSIDDEEAWSELRALLSTRKAEEGE